MLISVVVLCFLLSAPCQGAGYGSNLMSLLRGGLSSQPQEIIEDVVVKKIPEEHLYQEENDFKNKNLNHVYYKDITQKRNAKNVQEYDDNSYSLWDTINLSYAGNMDLANAVGKAKSIGTSMAEAIGAIVDLNFVRNVVDIAVDRLQEHERQGRSDSKRSMQQEELKDGITTVVGAALGEQQCWERTACKLGEYSASIPGKDIAFILFDRVAPSSWLSSINIIKDSATYEQDCNLYECRADPEGTENDV